MIVAIRTIMVDFMNGIRNLARPQATKIDEATEVGKESPGP